LSLPYAVQVRRLDVRPRKIRPCRYSHPAPPVRSPLGLGSLRRKAKRLGSSSKRLDWMRAVNALRDAARLHPPLRRDTEEIRRPTETLAVAGGLPGLGGDGSQ
jgi:hypothetical protein